MQLVALAGLILAVVSVAKREPARVMGYVCIVLNGVGLIR